MKFAVCTGSVQGAGVVHAIPNVKVPDLRPDADNCARGVPAKYLRSTNCGVASLAHFCVHWINGDVQLRGRTSGTISLNTLELEQNMQLSMRLGSNSSWIETSGTGYARCREL